MDEWQKNSLTIDLLLYSLLNLKQVVKGEASSSPKLLSLCSRKLTNNSKKRRKNSKNTLRQRNTLTLLRDTQTQIQLLKLVAILCIKTAVYPMYNHKEEYNHLRGLKKASSLTWSKNILSSLLFGNSINTISEFMFSSLLWLIRWLYSFTRMGWSV